MEEDYYTRLQVSRQATQIEIAKAFRAKALACHPDKTDDPAAASVFQSLSEAYNTLKDETLRSQYDTRVFISSLLRSSKSTQSRESPCLSGLVTMVKDFFEGRETPFTPDDLDEMGQFAQHNTVSGRCALCRAVIQRSSGRTHFLTEHFPQFRSWKSRKAPPPTKRRKTEPLFNH